MSRSTAAKHSGVDRIRPLNVPQSVLVELDEAGLPNIVVTDATEPDPKIVEAVVEVWKIEDEWWRDRISRRCVEVVLEGGKHVVLYEDQTTGKWFLQRP